MNRITTAERKAVLSEVAAAVLELPAPPRPRVGIDGIDGAGKTTFADELAELLSVRRPVIRAGADGFHHPKRERYRLGRESPEGFYRDSYDLDPMRWVLLDPLSPGGSGRFRRAVFDKVRDAALHAPEETAPADAILVFDGLFLHRPELRGYWDFSVYLSVPWARNHRLPQFPPDWPRDPEDPRNRRYVEGQRIYFRLCRPWERATVVVDNEDLAAPALTRRRA